MNLKKRLYLTVFTCAIFANHLVIAQHNEPSFQLSPHWLSGSKPDEDSPIVLWKDHFAGLGVSHSRFSSSGVRSGAGFQDLKLKDISNNLPIPFESCLYLRTERDVKEP